MRLTFKDPLTPALERMRVRPSETKNQVPYQAERSPNRLTGRGQRRWFRNSAGNWYLPRQWRLKNPAWNEYQQTKAEYQQNTGKNFKAIQTARRATVKRTVRQKLGVLRG